MTTAENFKALVARLHAEDRFFHLEDDINEFDMFTDEEKVEFGAIIDAAWNELGEEFAEIAFAGLFDEESV